MTLATEAGFATDETFEKFVPNGGWKAKVTNDLFKNGNLSRQGTWFVVAATK
ncbi:MAG: hypothetical protein V7K21_26920 [Nostoc sp.]|uniref:hypothetical protein n=1 Tax=Nostoc sp. TaxID=1180 RepID=UPI002FF881FD